MIIFYFLLNPLRAMNNFAIHFTTNIILVILVGLPLNKFRPYNLYQFSLKIVKYFVYFVHTAIVKYSKFLFYTHVKNCYSGF